MADSTILTLAFDEASQGRFEALRRAHYPAALNRIPAHLTLFHQLPGSVETERALQEAAAEKAAFEVRVEGVLFLGRGVALRLESVELTSMHRALSDAFDVHLTRQDRQRFRPHVVVQNKVSPPEARSLVEALTRDSERWTAAAVGLDWWDYLGGPWRHRSRFWFPKARG